GSAARFGWLGATVIALGSHWVASFRRACTAHGERRTLMVRKIRAKLVLELRAEGLSRRAIAASQSMSRNSVAAVLEAADRAGASWDDVSGMSKGAVYSPFFSGCVDPESVYAQTDLAKVHRELSRVGVTLKLLHGEYLDECARAGAPGMGYDRFCKAYQRHA